MPGMSRIGRWQDQQRPFQEGLSHLLDMTRRLKLSPDGVNSIIDIILSDEKLIGYVLALVSKRLTKDMREDPDWCNQVVDLSIEQVLQDVDITQLITNLCGTTSVRIKNGNKNNKKDHKVLKAVEPELITPPFSATEPHAVSNSSPRRVVKEMNKKKSVDLPPVPSSNAQFLKKALYSRLELDRSASVESNASTVPVVDTYNDGVIISTNSHTKREVEWPTTRSESSISSEHEDLYVSVLDSEAQASFREDPEVSRVESPIVASDTDSLDGSPPRSFGQTRDGTLGKTQTINTHAREITLGGAKNHTLTHTNGHAQDNGRPGQKVYKVPYKPTTYEGKLKADKDTAPTTTPLVSATRATTAPTTATVSTPAPHTPGTTSITPVTPLTHTNSVHDEDFLSSWEKQVLRGIKNGEESDAEGSASVDSAGSADGDENSLTPRASFENSFVDQLVRSPSKTLHEDLDQYELHSQRSDSPASQRTDTDTYGDSGVQGARGGKDSGRESSGGVTPELRVVSPHTALQLLHAPDALSADLYQDSEQQQEPQVKLRAQSAESDLTDPTQDSPRPQVLTSAHHRHHHSHHTADLSDNNDTGKEPESDSDDSYSSDSSEDSDAEDEGEDYLRAPPTQTNQLLFFDQSRFDADADYFASEGALTKKKSPPKKAGPRAKRTDADSPLRVRFAPRLISEVHYRDRVGYHEKGELFFTHNEEYQFTMDQSKEAERAEALGMTWMEWMEQRTDEDVQREEAEDSHLNDFRLYSGEYYEEDEHHSGSSAYNSLFSDTALHSTSVAPAGDHDFKAGNAHVSPVVAHHPHVLTTAQVLATHSTHSTHTTSNTTANTKQGGEVFSDELSVPSCSSDDDEYDFDNF